MARRLIIGDIHGHYDKMKLALDRAGFCASEDILFSVGDLCDRGSDPVKVLDFMFNLPNLKMVMGNHDLFMLEYLETGVEDPHWTVRNGGMVTLDAIRDQSQKWRMNLHDRLMDTPFALVDNDALVLHGGLSDSMKNGPLSAFVGKTVRQVGFLSHEYKSLKHEIAWNRSYYGYALSDGKVDNISRHPEENVDGSEHKWDLTLFIGHTTIKDIPPRPYINDKYKLVNVDTGSYRESGLITVMDMDSHEYWQA